MQQLLAVIIYIVTNKELIKQLVLQIENLIPDAPGTTKAGMFKHWIATAMNIENEIEQVWPLVKPVFDVVVAGVKRPAAVTPGTIAN